MFKVKVYKGYVVLGNVNLPRPEGSLYGQEDQPCSIHEAIFNIAHISVNISLFKYILLTNFFLILLIRKLFRLLLSG